MFIDETGRADVRGNDDSRLTAKQSSEVLDEQRECFQVIGRAPERVFEGR